MGIIETSNLSVSFGNSSVLEGVTFEVASGDFVGIAGPNGAGKSTLVKALLGLIPASTESIRILGQPIESFSAYRNIGYLPQKQSGYNLLLPATVEEAVLLGLLSDKHWPRRVNAQDRHAAHEALEELGIADLSMKSVSKLSGGQYQRVMLARALVRKPQLLILDEPTTGLDPEARESLFRQLRHINAHKGITILLITHDIEYISRYANKLLYIDRKILYYGATENFPHAAIHGALPEADVCETCRH
jgi:zinc transport system ATP-binding protein